MPLQLPPWLRVVWYAAYSVVMMSGLYGLVVHDNPTGAFAFLLGAMGVYVLVMGECE